VLTGHHGHSPEEFHVFGAIFMRFSLSALSAILVCVGFCPFSVTAQEPQLPGKEHQELAALEGTWDATMKMADGSEFPGVAEYKMTCEGMWLTSDFKADFGGLKFHGKGLDGYDSSAKQFVSVWVDSMSGAPMVLRGTKQGKVTTMTGEGSGPGGVAKYKTVTTDESSDKMVFVMSMVEGDKETEMMTVTYVRRKK
jgi:hypothetical protein